MLEILWRPSEIMRIIELFIIFLVLNYYSYDVTHFI
jgi:hypothetical protein